MGKRNLRSGQVCCTMFPTVDGPVWESLKDARNCSALIRDALYALWALWEAELEDREPGEIYQFKCWLHKEKDRAILDWLNSYPARHRTRIIRGAVYFWTGLKQGPSLAEPTRLAAEIVKELRKQGVAIGSLPPEEATDEAKALLSSGLLGSFS